MLLIIFTIIDLIFTFSFSNFNFFVLVMIWLSAKIIFHVIFRQAVRNLVFPMGGIFGRNSEKQTIRESRLIPFF